MSWTVDGILKANEEEEAMIEYSVTDDKKIRVIIDTDAACEADDQYAIAHALMTQKFIIKGITAEHFGPVRGKSSEQQSYEEIQKILQLMQCEEIPVFHGASGAMTDAHVPVPSEAAEFIIEEALSDSRYSLFIFCQGAVTNVASALLKAPEIAKRMTVISRYICTGGMPAGIAADRAIHSGREGRELSTSMMRWAEAALIDSMTKIMVSIMRLMSTLKT